MSNRFLLERERTALDSEMKYMAPEKGTRGTIDSIKQIQTILTNIYSNVAAPSMDVCILTNEKPV